MLIYTFGKHFTEGIQVLPMGHLEILSDSLEETSTGSLHKMFKAVFLFSTEYHLVGKHWMEAFKNNFLKEKKLPQQKRKMEE